MDLWNNPNRINHKPYFGWLQSFVPTYGNTLNIKTRAFEREVGVIPAIQVIEDNHPLRIDQENGITYQKMIEIIDTIMRKEHKSA
jgi:hypothetical protein